MTKLTDTQAIILSAASQRDGHIALPLPDSLRGTGAGLKLVEQLVADARAEGWKIIPLCPFVNAQRRKHPDWADAFQV